MIRPTAQLGVGRVGFRTRPRQVRCRIVADEIAQNRATIGQLGLDPGRTVQTLLFVRA